MSLPQGLLRPLGVVSTSNDDPDLLYNGVGVLHTGELCVTNDDPVFFPNGIPTNAAGSVCITTTPTSPVSYSNGTQFDATGRLVVIETEGSPSFSVAGFQFNASGHLVMSAFPDPVDWLTVTGTATEDQTLTAALGGGAPTVTSYQWLRGYTPISGATSSTYVLTDADVGRVMRVVANGDSYSAPTAAIAGVNDTPTGSVTISGTATQGQTLTAVTTTIADPDGLGAFSYQWRRAGTPISGATASTYTLVQADVGSAMSVVVSWTDGQGFSESLTSANTSAVANINDAPTGAPTISGTPTQGQVLTAVTSSIADADGLGAFSYQWLRNGSNISGATSSTYTLVQADVGTAVSVRVSYTDALGTAESLTSATVTVANINDAPGGSVVITGTPSVGQTLTADTSTVTDVDGLGPFTWQWRRAGVAISGATSSTYVVQAADDGTELTVVVSWIDAYGTAESLTSAGVTVSSTFNPLSWFAASEQGGIYDASDLSTLFQDAAGTVPVTTAGQTVKRWNDKSGRGNHMSNAAATWTYQVDAAGKPYVQTDGAVRLQTSAAIAWGSGAVTLVAATKASTGSQSATIVGFESIITYTGAWSYETFGGGPLVYRRGSGSGGGRSSVSVGTATTIFSTTIDLSGSTHETENAIHRTNGDSPALTSYINADTGSGPFETLLFTLGGGGTGSQWSGRIYHVIAVAATKSLSEIEAAETYSGNKAGYAVPFVSAQSPVWLDTVSPVTESGFVRTSPFSRAKYSTTAEVVSVSGYSNVSSDFNTMDQIAIYVDGAYSTSINPSANGAFNGTLALSAGTKTVEFVAGLQASPSQTSVLGTWFVGATASAAMTAVSETPSNRLVIYGDSIAVGANSSIPPKDAWAVLLRAERGSDSTVVEAYGSRSLHLDASDSTKRAAFVAKIQALNPAIIWIAIGTNDYGLTKWTDSQFGAAYASFLDDLHAAMPSLVIYCQTPILRSGEPTANGNGLFLSDFRTAISSAVSSRSAWATLVDGTAILTTGQLDDGVHPTTAGHAAYATYVAGVLGV